MTKLEEEIKAAMWHKGESFDDEVKAAAEVAKKYIEKALNDCKSKCGRYFDNDKWLKENGIIE